ncbi:MAG: adenylate kinase [Chthoniobacteraceae bacterium]
MKRRIVLLGPPASGKGTQAEMLRRNFQIPTASPGAMLREQKKAGTPLGIEAEKLTSRGQLLPDDLIVDLVKSWLDDHNGAFTFDGFPRTIGQALTLETLLTGRNTPLDVALSLDVGFDTILDRVLRRMVCDDCGNIVSIGLHVGSAESPCPACGGKLHRRSDDNEETLRQRMGEYREKSEPLISIYAERGVLKHIDASRAPEQVFADITEILEK